MAIRLIPWSSVPRPGNIVNVARQTMNRQPYWERHTHDFAEFFFVEHGQAVHGINDAEISLGVGDMYFIRPSDIHGFKPETGFRLVNIAFAADTLNFVGNRYFGGGHGFWGRGALPRRARMTTAQLEYWSAYADVLATEATSRLALERMLLNLLHEFPNEASPSDDSGPPQWLVAAHQRLSDPEVFRDGAAGFVRLAGRCPEHVARQAKRHFGKSPTQLVTEARMAYAANALAMSDREIGEIALTCGFNSLGHFYTTFRRRFGVPPRRFRLRSHHLVSPR